MLEYHGDDRLNVPYYKDLKIPTVYSHDSLDQEYRIVLALSPQIELHHCPLNSCRIYQGALDRADSQRFRPMSELMSEKWENLAFDKEIVCGTFRPEIGHTSFGFLNVP